ncbi:hypothetical protein PtB15_15B222 [Puccinia triticina]|nr:hypothetical protein PtB15_15B222 [Puccinia triticina]
MEPLSLVSRQHRRIKGIGLVGLGDRPTTAPGGRPLAQLPCRVERIVQCKNLTSGLQIAIGAES